MKRLIAMLLAAILLLSLAACGETGQDGKASETDPFADAEEYRGELPFVKPGDEPITITIGINTNGNVTDYKDNAFTKWLEEQTGLNLEFIQFSGKTSENATQIALMIASGEKLPDIMHPGGISKVQADEYGLDGYFLDLKPYFDHYAYYFNDAFARMYPDDPSVRERLLAYSSELDSGKIFNFPTIDDIPTDTPRGHTWINQEWLDKLGLQAPTTLQELHDVLVAFRDNDPNGNGEHDEIPMVGKADSGFTDIVNRIVNAYVYWNSSYHFNVGEDDKLYTPYTTDEYRQALCYINDLVREGLLSTLTWTQTAAELKGLLNPDDGVCLCGVITGHAALNFAQNSPSLYVYEPLAPFKGETPLGGYGARNTIVFYNTIYISATCEHPVEAFKLLDFMSEDEACLRGHRGIPGVNWEFVDPNATYGGVGQGAAFRIIGESILNTQNNYNWHNPWVIITSDYHITAPGEDEWTNLRTQKIRKNYENYVAAGQPEKLFTYVTYSREENERLSEIQKELTDFIKDRRAQFCTGVLDPRNDAQWQEYLDGLQALHYDEWLSLAQTAYDRMNGN